MSLIRMENICKTYYPNTTAAVPALQGLSLSIQEGDLLAVMGPSGSGKSTLLHIMGCLDSADNGFYSLNGQEISQATRNELAWLRNQKIGFVLQEFGLLLNQTVIENVSIPLMFSSAKYNTIRKKTMDVLCRLGIQELAKKKAGELSGGQKQRVAIARALVNNPDIILADEPTGSLDQHTAIEIMKLLMSLNEDGKTIVIVTHNPEIASCCHNTLFIRDGIIEEGLN